jgi:hypothetical protein
MLRAARVVAAGGPHHITQRGNNRQDAFLSKEDRRFNLDALRENSGRYGPRILGYCLTTNHVHLLALPERDNALPRAMQRTHAILDDERPELSRLLVARAARSLEEGLEETLTLHRLQVPPTLRSRGEISAFTGVGRFHVAYPAAATCPAAVTWRIITGTHDLEFPIFHRQRP